MGAKSIVDMLPDRVQLLMYGSSDNQVTMWASSILLYVCILLFRLKAQTFNASLISKHPISHLLHISWRVPRSVCPHELNLDPSVTIRVDGDWGPNMEILKLRNKCNPMR